MSEYLGQTDPLSGYLDQVRQLHGFTDAAHGDPNALQRYQNSIWPANNPVGTEYTQGAGNQSGLFVPAPSGRIDTAEHILGLPGADLATGFVLGVGGGAEGRAMARARIEKPTDLTAPDAWDQLTAWHGQQKQLAQDYADAGRPMRFTDPRYPHLSYLISPEMHQPGPGVPEGAWRITTFSKGEPWGHSVHNNAYDAFKEATVGDWQPYGAPPKPNPLGAAQSQ